MLKHSNKLWFGLSRNLRRVIGTNTQHGHHGRVDHHTSCFFNFQNINTAFYHTQLFERSITSKKKNFGENVDPDLISDYVLKMTEQEQQLSEKMKNDVVWNAFLAESEGYEELVWVDAKRRGKELTGDDIQAIKAKIKERKKEMLEKYKRMRKIYHDKSIPEQSKKQVYEDLARAFKENAHFVDTPEFQSVRAEFEKRAGFKIPEKIQDEYSPDQIEEFMKMLDGEEGKQLEEYMNRVLSDEVFAKMGINAQDYNPFLNPEKSILLHDSKDIEINPPSDGATLAPNSPTKPRLPPKYLSREEFETFKHSMIKDLQKHSPGAEQFFANETGQSLMKVLEDFYEEVKDQDLSSLADFLEQAKKRNSGK
ncbi:hypothetical protein FDP41_005135 [Naegleria fowleri]|uniref:Uncharacterized protein n=1 Tax=Naegleria fowleri TaxID=5763 RepID=A0A6A5BNS4_NAEFO|nr:uncharacterized protein FDP41_005135 [Naegleria fowleri]KAF0975808.1 hypothetical protein FDP41_005135 [Naegleria fowleri]